MKYCQQAIVILLGRIMQSSTTLAIASGEIHIFKMSGFHHLLVAIFEVYLCTAKLRQTEEVSPKLIKMKFAFIRKRQV